MWIAYAVRVVHLCTAEVQESAARIENNLTLIGATGIEDRLQDGVPVTIAKLAQVPITLHTQWYQITIAVDRAHALFLDSLISWFRLELKFGC